LQSARCPHIQPFVVPPLTLSLTLSPSVSFPPSPTALETPIRPHIHSLPSHLIRQDCWKNDAVATADPAAHPQSPFSRCWAGLASRGSPLATLSLSLSLSLFNL
jgi:hypothetical protein